MTFEKNNNFRTRTKDTRDAEQQNKTKTFNLPDVTKPELQNTETEPQVNMMSQSTKTVISPDPADSV